MLAALNLEIRQKVKECQTKIGHQAVMPKPIANSFPFSPFRFQFTKRLSPHYPSRWSFRGRRYNRTDQGLCPV